MAVEPEPRRSGRAIVLFVVASVALIVLVSGVWFLSGITWRHAQIRYTADPSSADVRTVEEISESPSSGDSYRRATWREVRVRGEEWVKDGTFVQENRAGSTLAKGTYRLGERQGSWQFWNEDGSIDASRSGTYANDELVHGVPSPKGDFDPD